VHNRPISEPVRSDADRELRMRCIEAAVRSPFSNPESVQEAAEGWYTWVVENVAPPMGKTAAARRKLEAEKRR